MDEHIRTEQNSRRSVEIMAVLGIMLYLVIFGIINFKYLACFADGDIYSDTLVAREMWRQKTIFPEGWIFGNQYYVIATPVIAALFYGLTGRMNLAMALATGLMSILELLCLNWMLRPLIRRRDFRLCTVLLFIAAPMGTAIVSEWQGQLFFILASYYACYALTLFFVLGDYIRARLNPEPVRPWSLIAALLLCFATGMQSLRQTAVMILPLLALQLLGLLKHLWRKEPAFPREERAEWVRTALYTAANLTGCIVIRALKIPSMSIYMDNSLATEELSQRVRALWVALRGISGLDAVQFGEFRVFFLLFFLFQMILILCAAVCVVRKLGSGPSATEILWVFCVISLAGVLLAGLLIQIKMRAIYLFVWYLWVALSLMLVLKEDGRKEKPGTELMKAFVAVAACILAICNLPASYGGSLQQVRDGDYSAKLALIEDAQAAGIEYIYGDWMFAPSYVALSDGALTGGFWDDILLNVNEGINLQNIYSEEDNQRALYLVNEWNHDYFLELADEMGAKVSLIGEYGFCTAWRSDRQLMNFDNR